MRHMQNVFFASFLLITFAYAPNAPAMDCGAPPQQFTEKVGAQGKVQAEGIIKKLIGGSVEGQITVVAEDLLSKYPNADKCYRTWYNVDVLPNCCRKSCGRRQKFEMVGRASEELLKWATPAPHSGGAGGKAKVVGQHSCADGGKGGLGGLGPGGSGGDAEVQGDNSCARGGDGGNAAQPDGRGGPRTQSQGERLNLSTQMWPYGYGGHGANHPEYDRRLKILTEIREEYMKVFQDEVLFINAGVEQVPIRWINKRLEEIGEEWRVQMPEECGYKLPPLVSN